MKYFKQFPTIEYDLEKDNNIAIKDYVFLDSNRQIIQTKKWN